MTQPNKLIGTSSKRVRDFHSMRMRSTTFRLSFLVANFVAFYLAHAFLGFEGVIPVACGMFCLTLVVLRPSFAEALMYGLTYLVLFDNDKFTFTTYKLRVWYPVVLAVLPFCLVRRAFHRRTGTGINAIDLLFGFALGLILLLLARALVAEGEGRLLFAKNVLFYGGVVFVFCDLLTRENVWNICEFFVQCALFVSLWGFLQLGHNLLGDPRFQVDFAAFRPSGFFSESTWYAEFGLFGLYLALIQGRWSVSDKRSEPFYFFVACVCFLAMVVSFARNPMLALIVFVVFAFVFLRGFLLTSILRVMMVNGIALVSGLLLLLIFLYDPVVGFISRFGGFITKLYMLDLSVVGRLEAFQQSFEMLGNTSFLFGSGFDLWDNTSTGTFIGAKSFNVFLMLLHQGGLMALAVALAFFGLPFLVLLRTCIQQKTVVALIGLTLLLNYLWICQFAPLHLYPFGAVVLGISLGCARLAGMDGKIPVPEAIG